MSNISDVAKAFANSPAYKNFVAPILDAVNEFGKMWGININWNSLIGQDVAGLRQSLRNLVNANIDKISTDLEKAQQLLASAGVNPPNSLKRALMREGKTINDNYMKLKGKLRESQTAADKALEQFEKEAAGAPRDLSQVAENWKKDIVNIENNYKI